MTFKEGLIRKFTFNKPENKFMTELKFCKRSSKRCLIRGLKLKISVLVTKF